MQRVFRSWHTVPGVRTVMAHVEHIVGFGDTDVEARTVEQVQSVTVPGQPRRRSDDVLQSAAGATNALPPALIGPEYPSLFAAAERTSSRSQHRSLRVAQIDISTIVLTAVMATLTGIIGALTVDASHSVASLTWNQVKLIIGWVVAVLTVISLLKPAIFGRLTFNKEWYGGRAVAEAVKTATWRYMMQTTPFDEHDAEKRFISALQDDLKAYGDLPLSVAAITLDEGQITPCMHQIRALPLEERKRYYLQNRIEDQIAYYARRSAQYERTSQRWGRVSITFRLATLAAAVLRILPWWFDPNSHIGLVDAALIGLFAALSAATAALRTLDKHDELCKVYAQVAEKLRMLRPSLQGAENNSAFSQAVDQVEDILSGENTSWAAKRLAP